MFEVRFGAVILLPSFLSACSFHMSVPDNYQADNTSGCAINVEDARLSTTAVSFGRSELVSNPPLSTVLQREACSRDSLRQRPLTIRITSAFCDTSEWASNAYAEVHTRAYLDQQNSMVKTMRKAKGTGVGTAPVICGNLLWPLAPQLVDEIEAQFNGLAVPIAGEVPLEGGREES